MRPTSSGESISNANGNCHYLAVALQLCVDLDYLGLEMLKAAVKHGNVTHRESILKNMPRRSRPAMTRQRESRMRQKRGNVLGPDNVRIQEPEFIDKVGVAYEGLDRCV